MSNKVADSISREEFFYGHKACAGCGGSLAVRAALKVLGQNAVSVLPAGCMSAVGFNFPQLCFSNNSIISTFAGTASMLTGVEAGLRAKGYKDFTAVGFAGDGGTADIGIQALSGAIDRNDNIIYICYDNEAYMNTGIQKSGLTPFGAKTTTTPAGANIHGNIRPKKNMFEIAAAHDIPYAATASVGYIADFIAKVQKASQIKGTKYIHVIAPCPTGWGIAPDETVNIAREVVDCGLWYLAEYENGEFTLNHKPKEFTDVESYLKKQGRFKHLSDEDIRIINESRDRKWEHINKTFGYKNSL
ncbi:pyruvate ferredoxin oxidoreductase beta subunit [Ruminococcus sp. YRD2003]|uniref:thiamine pyrophosphate-dependent enzyme n=1 Tax=Ruminococcus sp. YRD2003 TaxID=1452313 RepID=UPI0008C2D2AE|nr:pyruvate ferredoxin oxidoreductase beta subunit [Ruminococcus flavefaciens]